MIGDTIETMETRGIVVLPGYIFSPRKAAIYFYLTCKFPKVRLRRILVVVNRILPRRDMFYSKCDRHDRTCRIVLTEFTEFYV